MQRHGVTQEVKDVDVVEPGMTEMFSGNIPNFEFFLFFSLFSSEKTENVQYCSCLFSRPFLVLKKIDT